MEPKWKGPAPMWHSARSEFSIRFGERFRFEAG